MQADLLSHPRLKALSVIVVEDETLVAMLIEDMLADLGCKVLWTAHRVGKALDRLEHTSPQAAVLDVNIAGDEVYPVAAALADRHVPFLFTTGYGARGLQEPWAGRPIVQKPFQLEQLAQGLLAALEG